jgi:hypothetical protein
MTAGRPNVCNVKKLLVKRAVDICRKAAVAAITHHLAGLANIAKLLGKLQQPDLGADDLY